MEIQKMIVAYNIHTDNEVWALAKRQSDEGREDFTEAILGKKDAQREAMIVNAWKLEESLSTLEWAKSSRMEFTKAALDGDCVPRCFKQWIEVLVCWWKVALKVKMLKNMTRTTSCLHKLITSLLFPHCQLNGLLIYMDIEKSFSFSMKGQLFCNSCDAVIDKGFLCERVEKEVPSKVQVSFKVNVRATVAFRGIGAGQSAMKEWSALLHLPSCLSNLANQNLQQKLVEGGKVSS